MAKKVLVILGTVREGRAGKAVADWFMTYTEKFKTHADFELVDLAEVNLPFMNEPVPPRMGMEPKHEHSKAWARRISSADAFVFITPEYNHGLSPVLKNALDYLFQEWKDKPAALVGYGAEGALLSMAQLLPVMEYLGLRVLETQLGITKIWEALDEEGMVKDESVIGDPHKLIEALVTAIAADSTSTG